MKPSAVVVVDRAKRQDRESEREWAPKEKSPFFSFPVSELFIRFSKASKRSFCNLVEMPLPREKTAAVRTPADFQILYGNLGSSPKLKNVIWAPSPKCSFQMFLRRRPFRTPSVRHAKIPPNVIPRNDLKEHLGTSVYLWI